MTNPRFAVIATRNRPDVLQQCLDAIVPQVDAIFVIDNGDEKMVPEPEPGSKIFVLQLEMQPPNLSLIWNRGLVVAEYNAKATLDEDSVDGDGQGPSMPIVSSGEWEVAVLNDDAIVPEGWFDAVATAMRETGAAAGCSDHFGTLATRMLHTVPGPVGLQTRMCGWAHILAGEKGLRYDEELQYWFSDDSMDWVARQNGGMVIIPGFPVQNLYPNGLMTPELHVQAGKDRETFARKHNGLTPW